MYTIDVSDSKGDTIIKSRDLFRRFRVFALNEQLRAFECQRQQLNLRSCRALPALSPSGSRWQKENMKDYQPISESVIESITKPISVDDLKSDPLWLDDMRILVTSNADKAVLTACAAEWLARRRGQVALKWKKNTKGEHNPAVDMLLYDEDQRPNLFAYFVPGAPAQILDNANGNLAWGVGNGTSCVFHSLAWGDSSKSEEIAKLVAAAAYRGQPVIEIPYPPDFINVILQDADFNTRHDVN